MIGSSNTIDSIHYACNEIQAPIRQSPLCGSDFGGVEVRFGSDFGGVVVRCGSDFGGVVVR